MDGVFQQLLQNEWQVIGEQLFATNSQKKKKKKKTGVNWNRTKDAYYLHL